MNHRNNRKNTSHDKINKRKRYLMIITLIVVMTSIVVKISTLVTDKKNEITDTQQVHRRAI